MHTQLATKDEDEDEEELTNGSQFSLSSSFVYFIIILLSVEARLYIVLKKQRRAKQSKIIPHFTHCARPHFLVSPVPFKIKKTMGDKVRSLTLEHMNKAKS